MPGLNKVLQKMLHHICLTGIRILHRFWICQGSKYARVTQGSEKNAPLQIFDRVLNMPLVFKWHGYRELWLLCKLYSRDSRYSECTTGSQYTKILNVSGIWICYSFTGYIDGVLNISRVLNKPEFWICSGNNFNVTLDSNIQGKL